jgi:hypothetical protein
MKKLFFAFALLTALSFPVVSSASQQAKTLTVLQLELAQLQEKVEYLKGKLEIAFGEINNLKIESLNVSKMKDFFVGTTARTSATVTFVSLTTILTYLYANGYFNKSDDSFGHDEEIVVTV